MMKMTTIARPYAAAAFEVAVTHNALSRWQEALSAAAQVAEDSAVTQLLCNPAMTKKQCADLFLDVLAPVLDEKMQHFIRLLAENGRLSALPDILERFKQYRAEQEKTITVDVFSAVRLEEEYQQKLTLSLTKRLGKQVSLQNKIDPTVLGGVFIQAGDTVIDGTVRGKLARMVEFL